MEDKNLNLEPVLDYTPDELTQKLIAMGLPSYAGRQVSQWIMQKDVLEFEAMSNLKVENRRRLATYFSMAPLKQLQRQQSVDGTVKFLLACSDGEQVETVMIPSENGKRQTACISSQVGCNLGCRFCFTGTQKRKRNLKLHEVLGQILHLKKEGFKLTNIVFMGMGEPMDNYEVTLRACQALIDPNGFDFSHRRVTMSTSGLVPKLISFLQASPVNVAISLHAPNNELRKQLMPVSKAYSMEELLDACRVYFPKNRKRITFEYVLLKDINDQPHHARELVKALHGVRAKVNLIAFNPFPGTPYERSSDEVMEKFQQTCLQHGIVATLRASRGQDILAACGQLKSP